MWFDKRSHKPKGSHKRTQTKQNKKYDSMEEWTNDINRKNIMEDQQEIYADTEVYKQLGKCELYQQH